MDRYEARLHAIIIHPYILQLLIIQSRKHHSIRPLITHSIRLLNLIQKPITQSILSIRLTIKTKIPHIPIPRIQSTIHKSTTKRFTNLESRGQSNNIKETS
jgi:hypothetical protein